MSATSLEVRYGGLPFYVSPLRYFNSKTSRELYMDHNVNLITNTYELMPRSSSSLPERFALVTEEGRHCLIEGLMIFGAALLTIGTLGTSFCCCGCEPYPIKRLSVVEITREKAIQLANNKRYCFHRETLPQLGLSPDRGLTLEQRNSILAKTAEDDSSGDDNLPDRGPGTVYL